MPKENEIRSALMRMPGLARALARRLKMGWHLGLGGMAGAAAWFIGAQVTAGISAQEYLIQGWRTGDGLPSDTVTSIAQTADGYLWAGTLNGGLARFNGIRFEVFTPANTPALSDREIRRVVVDGEGTLWVGQMSGTLAAWRGGRFTFERAGKTMPNDWLQQLVGERKDAKVFSTFGGDLLIRRTVSGNGRWETFRPAGASHETVHCMDGEGRIWCAMASGVLERWTPEGVERLTPVVTEESGKVRALALDRKRQLWAATTKGLAQWTGERFKLVPPPGGAESEGTQLLPAADGGMWVRFESGLGKWQNGRWAVWEKPWTGPLNQNGVPPPMLDDRAGGLWFADNGQGLWHIRSDGHVHHLTERDGLPNRLALCMARDAEGNIWVGFEDGGLVRLRPRLFQPVMTLAGRPSGGVSSICESDDGVIWLGGVRQTVWRVRDGACEEVAPPGGFAGRETIVTPAAGDGGVWIGSILGGVWRGRAGVFEHQLVHRPLGGAVRVMLEDRSKRLWIGNEQGLWLWQNGRLSRFGEREGFAGVEYGSGKGASRLFRPFVHALAEDEAGRLWIGLAQGELRVMEGGRFSSFRPDWAKHWMRFWTLLPDAGHGLWIGTMGGGLLLFRDGRFERCTKLNGLPDDNVCQILDDGLGYLWLGTYNGIARVAKSDLLDFFAGRITRVPSLRFSKSEGMPADQFSAGLQPACARDRSGRLWFATGAGAVVVRPDQVTVNPIPPPVTIEEVRVNGKVEDMPAVPAGMGRGQDPPLLTVGPGKHHVEFRFAGLSLTAPEKVRYRWILDGAGQEWVEGGDQRTASYGLLPPGRYVFRVKACNNDGVWNEQGASLALVIQPFFWQTIWFQVLAPVGLAGLIGGAAFVVIRHRHVLQMERFRERHAMEKERARIARDLHDDLGANLTQIAWLGERVSRADMPAGEDRQLLKQIAARSRDMVRAIDEIVWALNPKNDTFENLVIYVCQFAEEFMKEAGVRCRIDVTEPIPPRTLEADRRHHLFLILKEALHNAAKHAGATEVWVRCQARDDIAQFIVEDNGRGFETDAASYGEGLANMRMRAAQMAAELEIQSRPGTGTRMTLRIAFNQQNNGHDQSGNR